MGDGAKGEAASKAGSSVEPSERITYSLLPLLMATEGRPVGKASTECLGVFVGWGVP